MTKEVELTVSLLKDFFLAKDLREIYQFLGMTITRTEMEIKIKQTKFIEKLLVL